MGIVYNRRLLFTMKIAKHMAAIKDEAVRKEAILQYPEDVQENVNRMVRLMLRGRVYDGRDD